MNKKITAGFVAVVAGGALVLTIPAFAEGHPPPPPEHGHIMLVGANEAELTYRKCVDLAAGKALRLNAHHSHVHTGRAGEALEGAGNFVIPTEDLLPPDLQGLGVLPADCAEVDDWLDSMREED